MKGFGKFQWKIRTTVKSVMILVILYGSLSGMIAEGISLPDNVIKVLSCKGFLIEAQKTEFKDSTLFRLKCLDSLNGDMLRNDYLVIRIRTEPTGRTSRPRLYSRKLPMNIQFVDDNVVVDRDFTYEIYSFDSELFPVASIGQSNKDIMKKVVIAILELASASQVSLTDRLKSFNRECFYLNKHTLFFVDFGFDSPSSDPQAMNLLDDFAKFSKIIREQFLSSFPVDINLPSIIVTSSDRYNIGLPFKKFLELPNSQSRSQLIEMIINYLKDDSDSRNFYTDVLSMPYPPPSNISKTTNRESTKTRPAPIEKDPAVRKEPLTYDYLRKPLNDSPRDNNLRQGNRVEGLKYVNLVPEYRKRVF